MSVKTEGQKVSIEIKSHSAEAKKLIEESLGSLRDSLSQKDLTLTSLSVVSHGSNSADGNFQPDANANRQNFDLSGQQFADQRSSQQWNQSEQSSGQQRLFEDESSRSNLMRMRPSAAARSNVSSTGSSQRLDMIA